MSSREKKMHKCSECVYSTNDKSHFILHARTHTGEKPFQCDQCNFASAHKGALICHRRTHTGEKPFQCDQCNFASAHRGALICHRRTHTGEKPFQCDQCNYASAQKGALIRHRRTHTGEKPFQCDQRFFKSAKKGYLTRRTHAGEKPFKCDQCNYACARKGDLIPHRRTHTGEKPFQCDQCNFASTQKGALICHRRTHTGEKPFQCDQCNYASAQKGTLICHRRTHSGEKPSQCDQSSQKWDLFSYKTRQSGGNPFGYRTRHKKSLHLHEIRHYSHGKNLYKCPTCDLNFATNKTLQVHRRSGGNQIGASKSPHQETVRQSKPRQSDSDFKTGGRYCLVRLRRLTKKQIESLIEKLHCSHAVKAEVTQPDVDTATVEGEMVFVNCVKQEPFYDFIDQVPIATVVTREELEYHTVGDHKKGVSMKPDPPIKIDFVLKE